MFQKLIEIANNTSSTLYARQSDWAWFTVDHIEQYKLLSVRKVQVESHWKIWYTPSTWCEFDKSKLPILASEKIHSMCFTVAKRKRELSAGVYYVLKQSGRHAWRPAMSSESVHYAAVCTQHKTVLVCEKEWTEVYDRRVGFTHTVSYI